MLEKLMKTDYTQVTVCSSLKAMEISLLVTLKQENVMDREYSSLVLNKEKLKLSLVFLRTMK
jgi:hypothetical protein